MGKQAYAIDYEDGQKRSIRDLIAKYQRSRQSIYNHLDWRDGIWHLRPFLPTGRPSGTPNKRAWWNEEEQV